MTEIDTNETGIHEIETELASRWARLGGAIIDTIIQMAIMVPIMWYSGILQRIFHTEQNITVGENAVLFVVGWVVFLILNGYLLFNRGQTIGKVVVKTKIVDLNGNVPNFWRLIFLRYFIFWVIAYIPFAGRLVGFVNAIFIFGKERRCLHDYIAGTRVINVK